MCDSFETVQESRCHVSPITTSDSLIIVANYKACIYVNKRNITGIVSNSCLCILLYDYIRCIYYDYSIRIFNNKMILWNKASENIYIRYITYYLFMKILFLIYLSHINTEKLFKYLFCKIFHTSYRQDFWTSRKITYLFAERIYFKFIFSR